MKTLSPTVDELCRWAPLFILPTAAFLSVPSDAPHWIMMWSMVFGLFTAVKWLSWWDVKGLRAPAWKQIAYFFAWPGMDARSFFGTTRNAEQPAAVEWVAATVKFLLGIALIEFAVAHDSGPVLIIGWMEMTGLVLLLHCGLFHLLSCLWRATGIVAVPIMNSPLRATSVSDFWGRRWNRAFRDLMYRFVFRPLSTRFGAATALGIGFLLSGFIHELVVTVPARGGYGGPTVFFLIQAVAMSVERSTVGKQWGLGQGTVGWVFTGCVILLPVEFLLPTCFIREVVVPFFHEAVAWV